MRKFDRGDCRMCSEAASLCVVPVNPSNVLNHPSLAVRRNPSPRFPTTTVFKMKKALHRIALGMFAIGAMTLPATMATAQAIAVEIQGDIANGYTLLRGGQPYEVHGVGGQQELELLVASGGNSIRTWGVDQLSGELLDEAHRQGISVVMGIWLGHERHGFDYTDMEQVADQFDMVREAVIAYRDHPAVLMWGIGNEMEGYEAGDNAAIWSHIQACAAMVKELDPNHPTMTVIAEIGGRKVESIHRLCPDIDVIGINTYGGVTSIPDRYREIGGEKPYMITEFGPPGTWEVGRNDFDAAQELSSTAKGAIYEAAFEAVSNDGTCIGSYAFLWGHKVESTATWFGMFLADGSKVEAVDAMTRAWTGSFPSDRCPQIETFVFDQGGLETRGAAGEIVTVRMDASDPEGSALSAEWVVRLDPMTYETMGDDIPLPPAVEGAVSNADAQGATLTLPEQGGVYRVYVVVKDAAGNAAAANLPLFVQDAEGADAGDAGVAGRDVDLPFAVYTDGGAPEPWTPSGYMGNTEAIEVNNASAVNPKSGETCMQVDYRANADWGGVVWQNPANDWGDEPGGFDLRGATALTFWARGQEGGEVLTFGYGLLGADATHSDSSSGKIENVTLTSEWQQYTIPLEGRNLQRIKTGFYWTVAGSGRPVRFYLDDVQYVED